ncbi:LysR family transcriptional regulator [Pseudomonas taiwanensis]|uniref:LysR family transcriptional regulator n=1 Tax=Pseudomonas taiwanensis TaxID=470150 RepID=UPI0021177E01|nr:LysR family transcriptional regulator [Pseudomonas taiwanensis]
MGFRQTSASNSGEARSVSERMDWNLLKTFCAVATEKSISRGAERLHLSQPAVSQAIKRLEEQLGCTLIDRDSHRFELTDIGSSLFRVSLTARQSIREIDSIVDKTRSNVKGSIRLLTVSGVNCPEYDDVLRGIHQDHPGITFSIEVASTQEIISALHRNDSTFGIGISQPGDIDINQLILSRERTFFYCSNLHPLFNDDNVTPEKIKSSKLVSFSGESLGGTLPKLSEHYGSNYIRHNISASSANTGEVLRLVLAGLGVSSLPEHLCREYEERGLLRKLMPEVNVCEVLIVLMWSAHQVRTQAEEIFLKRMQAALGHMNSI